MTSAQTPERAGKEVDIDLLVFIERYANDLLKWDLISFFARNPDLIDTSANVARGVGRDQRAVRSELGDLVILGILERDKLDGDHIYHLTRRSDLRRLALKFAQHLNGS
jgi:hypothetical protein